MTASDVPTIAMWLRSHIPDIVRHEWAAEMLDEITDVNRQMTRLIDTPPAKIYVGRCEGTGRIGTDATPDTTKPGDDDYLDPCGTDLYVREDDRHHLATVRCGVCGSVYSLAIRQEWVRQQYLGRLVTIAEGATLLGVPRKTVESWVYRKKIRPAFTGDDRNVYLFDEMIELARTTRRDAA
jgi:hypothetical protein